MSANGDVFAQPLPTITNTQQIGRAQGYTQALHDQSARTGGTPAQQPRLDLLAQDATLRENNLPDYMGKLEPGTFIQADRGWTHTARSKKQGVMRDQRGNILISESTGNEMKYIPLLPATIPRNVEAWHLNYWMRKAAETGVYLSYEDVADRMPGVVSVGNAGTNSNTLSMRVQRYIEGIGQLSIVEKKQGGLPAHQSMETIEQLYIIQGKLNTWWLPNSLTNRGPWIVVQPKTHAGYDSQLIHTPHSSSSVIEQAYGLSDRIKRTSDGMVFLDITAQEAGLQANAQGRKEIRKTKSANEWDEEFDIWRTGRPQPVPTVLPLPTVLQISAALENATTEDEVLAIMSGEEDTITALQAMSAIKLGGGRSLWSRMTEEKVASLMVTARLNDRGGGGVEWAEWISNDLSGIPSPPVTPDRLAGLQPGGLRFRQRLDHALDADDAVLMQCLLTEISRSNGQ
ncbi:hypothetical protein LTR65_001679 [Meristemomyces frigidus]